MQQMLDLNLANEDNTAKKAAKTAAEKKTMEEKILSEKTIRNLKRAENQKYRKEYELDKQRLLKLERENYEYILLIRTQDDWYKMMSHSAVMYLYYVIPLAKDKFGEEHCKTPKLLSDTDFRYKAPIGVISFKDLSVVKKMMSACGSKQEKVENSDRLIAYRLNRKMTEKEFWEMEKSEEELWSKINRTIVPDASYPDLGVDVRELTKLVYDVARKLPREARELVGYNLINLLRRVETGLIGAEKGNIEWKNFFSFAPKLLMEVQADINILADARVEDKKILLRIAEATNRVENNLKQARKRYEKSEKD